MREILFRGKRVDNGGWMKGYYVKAKDYLSGEDIHIIFGLDVTSYPRCEFSSYEVVIPETVGQSTGLSDKNGNPIWEGDIVREAYGNYYPGLEQLIVEMDDGRCGWFPFACGDGCGCCEDETWDRYMCEVIGNIHDNPELLKECKNDD